jgi:glycosyltransferase involved in cell wall biosynthesis
VEVGVRILFVNENIGGHATAHLHLEAALARHPGIDAEFFHVPAPGWLRRAFGVRIPGLARLDLDLQSLRAQLALSLVVRRALRRRAGTFDVLHVYTQNAGLLSAGLLRSVPSVVTTDATNALNAYRLPQRSPTRWTPKLLPLSQAFERRVYGAATLVVANSQYVEASLRDDYRLYDDRLRLQPIGIQIPDMPADSPTKTRPGPLPTITFVGHQLERKGGRRLIRLHQQHLATRCVLDLVTTETVEAHPNVRVHGDITAGDPRLWTILAHSTAFVFPSEIDSFGYAVLEAMAMGVPIVALRAGAMPEIIEDGVSGFLVDPGDDQGLVSAIETLLDAPDLRARMGAAARQRVQERYDIRRNAAGLVEILIEARERFGAPRS